MKFTEGMKIKMKSNCTELGPKKGEICAIVVAGFLTAQNKRGLLCS